MKYLLLLPVLALIGAGCASNPTVPEPADNNMNQVNPYDGGAAEPVENETDEQKNTQETKIITDDGSTMVIETQTPDTSDNDGIPVTEIVLGGSAQKIDMDAGNFFFTPKTIEAKPGEKINIMFSKNVGFHTFVIDKIGLKHAIVQGEGLVFSAPTEPGSYPFYCDIGSHRASGMEGVLIVK